VFSESGSGIRRRVGGRGKRLAAVLLGVEAGRRLLVTPGNGLSIAHAAEHDKWGTRVLDALSRADASYTLFAIRSRPRCPISKNFVVS
jgi:hypothetical protein